jgi:hypothetical protein
MDELKIDKEILLALGRLEGKVDALISRQSRHDKELAHQERRIRQLEQSKAWLFGAAAIIGGIASIVVTIIGNKI